MRTPRPRPVALLCLAPLLAACGETAPEPAVFEHRPALREGLAAAEREVAKQAEGAGGPAAEVDPEHVAGLVHMLAGSRGKMRDIPLEEIVTLGEGAAPQLAVIATGEQYEAEERAAACELLAKLETPLAVEHLLQLFEKSPESWLRAQAVWRLGTVEAEWTIPRILRRFKYEKDEETVIWMAVTLAAHGNYTGLDVLWRLGEQGTTEPIRAQAAQRLQALATEVGVDTPREHWDLWFTGDPERRLYRNDPSPRLRLAVWREIEQLSGEHFQLRGVDESRFVLSRMGAWAADPLSRALRDEDVYVRVHSAQCLERMGARGRDAGPALIDALADPTVATQAAAALGGIGSAAAEPVLRRRMEDAGTAHELRVACTASLGRLGLPASVPSLEALVASDEPYDLRQTAADSLIRIGSAKAAARFLFDALSDPVADRPGAESSLERWLEAEGAELLREQWAELAPPPGVIHTPEQAERRREARRQLLEKSGVFE